MLYGERLKQICEKIGVDRSALPDRLYSTLLNAIYEKSAGVPSLGALSTEWDDTGYITAVTFYGTTIPGYYFRATAESNHPFANLKTINFASGYDNIVEIGQYAFAYCTKLEIDKLSATLTSIPTYVFDHCFAVTVSKIPSSVETIGRYAFRYCSGLTSLTFEGTPTSIDSTAFASCSNLVEINVPWAEGAVAGAPWGATNAVINYNSEV